MKKILLMFFILFIGLSAQEKKAESILEKVKKNFDLINDYQADIKIKLDVSFMKMPESKAKVYFKSPDKFQFDSEGFAMLPKEGLNYNPSRFLTKDIISIYVGEELFENKKSHVIKILPNNDTTQIILTTLWIDSKSNFIRKIESIAKIGGNIQVLLSYKEGSKYPLPEKVKFSFNVAPKGKSDIPENVDADIKNQIKKNEISGDVYLTYSNYKINKGISDKIFEKKKK